MTEVYSSFAKYLKDKYGCRVQKIIVNAGFTCPNRDGTKSFEGCFYCNPHSFTPSYASPNKSITQQLEEGIKYFSKKYPTQKYIAYFQNYTNTFGPIDLLKSKFLEAINFNDQIIGIAIATRPDCISENIVRLIKDISKEREVFLEIGAESLSNNALKFCNRAHTFEDTIKAIDICKKFNIWVTLHLIIGLPYDEIYQQPELFAKIINNLQINCIKFHQLQILKNTKFEKIYNQNPNIFNLFSLEDYLELIIKYLERFKPSIFIERFTNEVEPHYLIVPKWNKVKNYQFVHLLRNKMIEMNTYQGKKCIY